MKFAKFLIFPALILYTSFLSATPKGVELFSPDTWSRISTAKSHAQVTIFTTTDCQHCPAVIEYLADFKKNNKKLDLRLNIVVMDGLGHEDYLLSSPYYLLANNLYAFNGSPSKLRYVVNPEWRGMTPFVVLHPLKQLPLYVYGKPDKAQLKVLN